ncbi:MAG TPA: YetF domain-containing protein [Thermoanaerobaculia bacterium]|nr:YetF domain-containing protein [Thermoanaerobaculia bacterium]
MSPRIFWDGWQGPVRVVLFGLLCYLFLILILRITGKRTLSKMNAFDFVITVATGSTFATVLLSKSVTLVEGFVAFLVLVLMQYGVAWLSVRSAGVEAAVKSTPTVLVWRGEMLHGVMRRERVSEAEVLAACREAGLSALEEAHAVVLETAGEFSVLRRGAEDGLRSTLEPCGPLPGAPDRRSP